MFRSLPSFRPRGDILAVKHPHIVALALAVGSVVSQLGSAQQLPPPGQAQETLQQAIAQNPGLADEIRGQIQASGLTPDQIRARLAASGYPPDLLDAYFGPMQPSAAAAPEPSELAALEALGLHVNLSGRASGQALHVDTGMVRGENAVRPESLAAGNYVFGVDVFRRTSTEFLPVLAGPVPQDYPLGPGDELVVLLTGDVELTYTLPVTREGFILIPQVGEVFVAHLTLDQLRDVLYTRLGKVYSSVRRGPDGKTRLDVSVANVRVNQVYVVGEVRQPGAYQISALGTALTALYAAGGVTARANMREIEIRRLDKVMATLDLYDYLLRGDTHSDIRLETGDVVFVPLHGTRAQVTGAVLRPAVYELKPGEALADLVRAAGGFRPDAALERLSVYRIVPIPDRGTGPFPRAVVNVQLPIVPGPGEDPPGAPAGEAFGHVLVPTVTVEPGDSVVVDSLPTLDASYFVTIDGAVNKAGRYPWRAGMTLRDLMVAARGPAVGAYLQQAEIARLPADRSAGQLAQTIRVPLDSTYLTGRDSAGRFVGPPGLPFPSAGTAEVWLQPFDNVLILRQPAFTLQQTVTLAGQVRFPGSYALVSGKDRLVDVIERAGGLTPLAYPDGVRFVRTADRVGRINVDLPRALRERDSRYNVVLLDGDSIVVPQFEASVKVVGAVNAPGSVLWEQGRDLAYYVDAAGGLSYKADAGRISVRYANGRVRVRHATMFSFGDPKPGPGSEVVVPQRDLSVKKPDIVTVLGVVAQIVSATVTLVVVAKQ